jgi:amino acid transporter
MYAVLKRIFIGAPIASAEEGHQRLSKKVALPVFASDAISSTAYATDEILVVLLGGGIGVAAFTKLVPIAVVVCVLLTIVVISYRQTLFAYPSGGGSYIVSRENLGRIPALVAGASLLTDYVLTVAVSVAGGVLAIRSASGLSTTWAVPLCLLCILIMTTANLRGMKESGALFAPPTYIYIGMLMLLIVTGLFRIYVQDLGRIPHELLSEEAIESGKQTGALSLMLLLRAFSSGAVALSGVEAVSNGVPAFRKPESRNASMTLMWMAIILGSCFFGVSWLSSRLQPLRTDEDPTVLALMAEHVFGGKNLLFWAMQISTFAILILAANTAYADFPRLASIIARDGYIPRQFQNRGDRLVFSNGVIVLAILAGTLVVVFGGNISALIPLYALGVFTGFTLSQAGMVVHHFRLKEAGWRSSAVINGVGMVATFIVAVVVLVSKFTSGAWIPAIVIPLFVVGFLAVGRHYAKVREAVAVQPGYRAARHTHLVIVLVGTVNKGVMEAVSYARSLAPDRLLALSVVGDAEEQERIAQDWERFGLDIELHSISSPYRLLTQPILRYLDELDAEHPDERITVVVPEFVTSWKTQWLHNQSAFAIKARLLHRPNTVVTSVPVVVD